MSSYRYKACVRMRGFVGDRIKQARLARGLSQQDLADSTGIKRVTIHAWESGANQLRFQRTGQREAVRRIAAALGVTEAWLWEGKPATETLPLRDGTQEANIARTNDSPTLPYYGTVSAGRFDLPECDVERRAVEDPDLVKEGRLLVTVVGDSMHPRLQHGDEIVVQRTEEPHHGLVSVLYAPGEGYTVKVTRRTPEGWELAALNKDFPPVTLKDGLRIVGVVLGYKRRVSGTAWIREHDEAGLRPEPK